MTINPDKYPEHVKMQAVIDDAQIIGEFMDWLESEGYYIARYEEVEGYSNPQLVVSMKRPDEFLSSYFGIDQQKVESEKRQILDELRAAEQ